MSEEPESISEPEPEDKLEAAPSEAFEPGAVQAVGDAPVEPAPSPRPASEALPEPGPSSPKRRSLLRRIWDFTSRHAAELALLLLVFGEIRGCIQRQNDAMERRAVAKSNRAERRMADSAAIVLGSGTLEAVQRIAAVQDSANQAAREAAAAERRATRMEAEAQERNRRDRVAVYDAEMSIRLALLTDSLGAIGIEPVSRHRDHHDFRRYGAAFRAFLRPRNVNGTWLEQKTTYELVSGLRGLLRGSEPEVTLAARCLEKITQGRERVDVVAIIGSSNRSAPPDTAVFSYNERFVPGPLYLPVSDAIATLSLLRWRSMKTDSFP